MADMGSHSLMMTNWAMKLSFKSSRSFVITPTGRKILSCNFKPRQSKQPKAEESTTNNSGPKVNETNSTNSS